MEPILELVDVATGYGPTQIIEGVSFVVPAGSGLALLGRNGAGKTTLMRAIAGRLRLQAGAIRLGGRAITGDPASRRCRAGLGFVPQERQIFATLTVDENLRVADLGGDWTIDAVYELFPRLAERRRNGGGQLSGGEQQMLAIGRALMSSPTCLLLDEPFEGLAPVIVDMLLAVLVRLREQSMAMIVVEQHAKLALEIADAAVVLERGRIRTSGARADLLTRWHEVEDMLAVTH